MAWVSLFLAVFAGGALGSAVREAVVPLLPFPAAYWATFTANVLASFAIGLLYAVRHRVHERWLHLGAVGFCGGLSTFSTFAAEVAGLAQAGDWAMAVVYPAVSIVCGIAAAAIGERLLR